MNAITPSNPDAVQLELQVIVSEEDKSVYVKFEGFETVAECDKYADYLTENLALLLFESEIRH